MSSCQLTVLGSSSGMPSVSRFCSSIFVRTGNFGYLWDCGEGTSFSLLRNRIDPQLIEAIFISHAHIDHLGGLFLLVQMMYLERRRLSLSIFVPEEAVAGVKNFLNTCYLFPGIVSFGIHVDPVTDKFEFEHEGIIIKTHPNRHLMGNQTAIEELKLPHKMQSFCYVLDINGKKIVYSGDIASSDDLAGIVEDSDLLITECFHPKLVKLFSLISESRVKSVVFAHIPTELEGKEEEILIQAKTMGLENFILAYDGLTIAI